MTRFRFRMSPEEPRSANGGHTDLGGLVQPRPGILTIDFRSTDGANVDDGAFRDIVRLAENGSGEALAVGREAGDGSSGVLKAWESTKSSERVVEEMPLAENDSYDASESRLLKVLATVPMDPQW